MLRIECKDGNMSIALRGSMSEITSDIVCAMREIRKEINRNSDDFAFDLFLKEVFVDMIIADDTKGAIDAVLNHVRGMNEDETEHK